MFGTTYYHFADRSYNKYFAIKVIMFLAVLFCLVGCFNQRQSYAESLEDSLLENIEDKLNKLDLDAIERFVLSFQEKNSTLFEGSFLDKVRAIIDGKEQFDYTNFFSYILNLLFEEILQFIPLLASVVIICIICSLFSNISPDRQGEKVGKVIYFACFSLVAVMIFSVFKGLLADTGGVLDLIKNQMQILFPILLTLITSIGSVVTVSTFQPVVVLLSSSVVSAIASVVMPLFIFSFVFNIVGNLSSNVKLEKCSKFLSSLFKWLIGTIFGVFMTILSFQGIMASVTDSISIKTTKFALKSYVPFVGNYVSDGLGLILASSVIIKNAVGVAGLFLLVGTIILPLVKIVVFMLGLKLVSAIVEPLSNNGLANFLYGSSKCLNMLLACIISVGFMYVITIGLLMCSANIF